jgi:hypothetical protein
VLQQSLAGNIGKEKTARSRRFLVDLQFVKAKHPKFMIKIKEEVFHKGLYRPNTI